MKDTITIRGERELWIDFIHKAKKEKKKAWEVLSPFLKKFLSSDQENRVLLIKKIKPIDIASFLDQSILLI